MCRNRPQTCKSSTEHKLKSCSQNVQIKRYGREFWSMLFWLLSWAVCCVKPWHPRLSWKSSPFHPYSSLIVCWGSLLSKLYVAYNMSIHVQLASHKVPLRWKGDWEIYISYVPRGKMIFLLVKRLPACLMCESYLIEHDFIQRAFHISLKEIAAYVNSLNTL